eukprot:TRINITY_DN60996_c0_g1_i1.p1 TRINITY_DN60996_c0_g1~~TRINITY_DN60996_c0_g1_i1.p1  ORF type:complete len:229 (+),score=31.80 TRINITY_DN60996_c0_g1_i1:84-770(+)
MFRALVTVALLRSSYGQVQEALNADDECSGDTCSLNALQVKSKVAQDLLARTNGSHAVQEAHEVQTHLEKLDTETLLDHSVQQKKWNNFCKNAPEGQNCIPESRDRSKLQAYIYCSAGRQLSAGIQKTCSNGGTGSWCQMTGSGLTTGHCDDPFCRNGGAYAGNGMYCHNGNIVTCRGNEPPVVVSTCSQQVPYQDCSSSNGHYSCSTSWRTEYCGCSGGHNYVHCNC